MSTLDYILLAVKDPRESAKIYDRILGVSPVENSETFVLYVLANGFKVGLWQATEMEPAPKPAGGSELSFSLADKASVTKTYDDWKTLGLKIEQTPTDMDFGFTFVASDADGHRLRPFAPNPR